MKQQLMMVMTAMMPFMKPLTWAAVAALVAGLVAAVARRRRAAELLAGFAGAAGAFFLAAWVMGLWMGALPSVNFGDARKMEFVLVPFWQLGLGLLGGWLALRLVLARLR